MISRNVSRSGIEACKFETNEKGSTLHYNFFKSFDSLKDIIQYQSLEQFFLKDYPMVMDDFNQVSADKVYLLETILHDHLILIAACKHFYR